MVRFDYQKCSPKLGKFIDAFNKYSTMVKKESAELAKVKH